jgi:hypothetical protein
LLRVTFSIISPQAIPEKDLLMRKRKGKEEEEEEKPYSSGRMMAGIKKLSKMMFIMRRFFEDSSSGGSQLLAKLRKRVNQKTKLKRLPENVLYKPPQLIWKRWEFIRNAIEKFNRDVLQLDDLSGANIQVRRPRWRCFLCFVCLFHYNVHLSFFLIKNQSYRVVNFFQYHVSVLSDFENQVGEHIPQIVFPNRKAAMGEQEKQNKQNKKRRKEKRKRIT